MDKVKIAVVGCGAISDVYFRNLINEFSILDVVACCDLNDEAARRVSQKYGITVMTMDEITASGDIEIVVNLTQPTAHYDVIRRLLESGKHVYTEKVITPDIAQARELVALAKANNLLLCSAPDTFLGAAVQTVRGLVESDIIGTVTSCVAVLQRDARLLAEKFPFTARVGGGIGIDVGIYYSTALINVLGPVDEVCGMSGIMFPEQTHYFTRNSNFGEPYRHESETYLMGVARFRSGCVGSLHFNSRSIRTEKPYVAFYGTEGILTLQDPNFFGGDVRLTIKGQTESIAFPHTHGYDGDNRGLGVAEMAWSLRKGRLPRTNADMALHAMEILTGVIESGQTKAFYTPQSDFTMLPMLPKGYLGESYAANDPEAGLGL